MLPPVSGGKARQVAPHKNGRKSPALKSLLNGPPHSSSQIPASLRLIRDSVPQPLLHAFLGASLEMYLERGTACDGSLPCISHNVLRKPAVQEGGCPGAHVGDQSRLDLTRPELKPLWLPLM